jgi:hypothetical protein
MASKFYLQIFSNINTPTKSDNRKNKSSQSRIERFKREKSIHENKLAYGI